MREAFYVLEQLPDTQRLALPDVRGVAMLAIVKASHHPFHAIACVEDYAEAARIESAHAARTRCNTTIVARSSLSDEAIARYARELAEKGARCLQG